MMRWDIINHFIKKNGYKSYLEIGYYKGWSFDRVECDFKTAVDPNPSKTPEQESLLPYEGKEVFYVEKDGVLTGCHTIYKMTSDQFFKAKNLPLYDIIFIDGLHEAGQVTKDIENSLKHLSEGGVIIMHDCNPPKYEHTTTGIDGCWTGDTYKAAIEFQDNHGDWYSFYCIDTDWGVGVIQKRESEVSWMNPHSIGVLFGKNYSNRWEAFDENRKNLLNLISVEEFKQLEQYEPVA